MEWAKTLVIQAGRVGEGQSRPRSKVMMGKGTEKEGTAARRAAATGNVMMRDRRYSGWPRS